MDQRASQLKVWIDTHFPESSANWEPLAGDASFRRYFRVRGLPNSALAVDSPPDRENGQAFYSLATFLKTQGIRVPHVFHADLEQGFFLLEDFGDDLFFHVVEKGDADEWYRRALDRLVAFQECQPPVNMNFATFSFQEIRQELENFVYWYLIRHVGLCLSGKERKMLDEVFDRLIFSAAEQPMVCVHRDYHSRNLMCTEGDLGIIDFQDALWGPVTYDAVSLLRDCYILWPEEDVSAWFNYFYEKNSSQLSEYSLEQCVRWFDWMGLQRHMKAIFIFARKFHRDHSTAYLPDIERGLQYLQTILPKYPEFREFFGFLEEKVAKRQASLYKTVVASG